MFDIPKLMQVLSEILSDKYGCTIIMTAIPKDQAECKGDLPGYPGAVHHRKAG